MGSITEEVADIEQHQDWNQLFHEIKLSSQYNLSCQASKLNENRLKNRYTDVSPFDHSRIKLSDGLNDYINANLVEIKDAGRRYVLSQGPLPNTAGQFWQMVWEQQSRGIIMLNRLIEKGMVKCHGYWPVDENNHLEFSEEGFAVFMRNAKNTEDFIIREIELVNIRTNESRAIMHFHFTAWPDFDVPHSPAAFLNFLAHVREYGVLENDCGPAIIHCSAGIGRSGTFILIDASLNYLQQGIVFNIRKTLLEMRMYRMGLVQTPQQLRFSYFAIAECERIIMYKQSDDDSFSEGTPSDIDLDEYDFTYNDTEQLNSDNDHMSKGQNNDDRNDDDFPSHIVNGETTDTELKKYEAKHIAVLNNNIDVSNKLDPACEIQKEISESSEKDENECDERTISHNRPEMQIISEKSSSPSLTSSCSVTSDNEIPYSDETEKNHHSNQVETQRTSDTESSKSADTTINLEESATEKIIEIADDARRGGSTEILEESVELDSRQNTNNNPEQHESKIVDYEVNKEIIPEQLYVDKAIKTNDAKQSAQTHHADFHQTDTKATTPDVHTEAQGLRQRNTVCEPQLTSVDKTKSTHDDNQVSTMYFLIGIIASIIFAMMMYTAYKN